MKKKVRPAIGCAQHPKAGRNTQQLLIIEYVANHGKRRIIMTNQ